MDPIAVLVTAIAAGAAAGLKPTVEKAIVDAYQGFKGLLAQRFETVDIRALERKPESVHQRAALAESLAEAGAGDDPELVDAAEAVVRTVAEKRPDVGPRIGVDIAKFTVDRDLCIEDVYGPDGGVRGSDWAVKGSATFKGVRAGGPDPN